MRFGRDKSSARRGGGRSAADGAAPVGTRSQSAPIDLGPNTGTDGLPGRAGYPNGPRTDLPTFFLTRRPDGRPEPVYRKKRFFG